MISVQTSTENPLRASTRGHPLIVAASSEDKLMEAARARIGGRVREKVRRKSDQLC